MIKFNTNLKGFGTIMLINWLLKDEEAYNFTVGKIKSYIGQWRQRLHILYVNYYT